MAQDWVLQECPLEPAPGAPRVGLLKTLGAEDLPGRCGTLTPCSAGQARLPKAEPNLQMPGLRRGQCGRV